MRSFFRYLLSPFILIWTGCNSSNVNSKAYELLLSTLLDHSVKEINVSEIENSEQYLFIDSRELKEYEVSHIKNAQFVGYNEFKIEDLNDINKEQPIIVYCSVGYRSEKIAQQLIQNGFSNVSNLYGGIFEWINEDLPVFDNSGETKKIHGFDKKWSVWLTKGEKVY